MVLWLCFYYFLFFFLLFPFYSKVVPAILKKYNAKRTMTLKTFLKPEQEKFVAVKSDTKEVEVPEQILSETSKKEVSHNRKMQEFHYREEDDEDASSVATTISSSDVELELF